MHPLFSILLFLAPLALIATWIVSLSDNGMRPARTLLIGRIATLLNLAIAIFAAAWVVTQSPGTSFLIGFADFGLSIRLDALSVIMWMLVAFVGAIVMQFSRNYLDGDDRQGMFIGALGLTLAAVTFLVTSGNLLGLVAAWIGTSLALHRLLIFYPERPVAILAAKKKFITARIGDACLVTAAILLISAFGTGDIATILERAERLTDAPVSVLIPIAASMIAFAALLKSAQFPAHGWLPEVMETPTPVSALLHAGIINAGGFLVIRFADVMVLSVGSMHLLAIVGGFTALFGAVVMLTRTSVKVSLAWSTVSQMGFMILQCGLGAFSLATLHIVAHSLYKAHAFLSSGSVVDIARASWVPDMHRKPRIERILASLGLSVALYAGIGWTFGFLTLDKLPILALGAIVIMGLTLLLAQSMSGKPSDYAIGRTLAAAGVVTIAYFLLQTGANIVMAGTVPEVPTPGVFGIAIIILAVSSFAIVAALQILAPVWADAPAWRAARVHLSRGLYVNALFNRLVGATRASTSGQP